METQIRFFVVTTLYKSSSVIRRTLDSLLEQTRCNFVHFIYEDGSDDPFIDDIISSYISTAEKRGLGYRIVYEKGKANLGCDKAHEYAFSKMDGTHLIWLDQGDCLYPKFFEAVTKEIINHPGCGWYHINSRYYDLKTGHKVGKSDYFSHSKRLLRREYQLPSLFFGEFYYNNFVISKKALQKAYPCGIEFVDKPKHGGLFYDAQIILLLIALNEKMRYIRRPLSWHMLDSNSVATDYRGDPAQKRATIEWLFGREEVPIADDFVSFFYNYHSLVQKAMQTHVLCRTKGGAEKANANIQSLVSFLVSAGLPLRMYYPALHKHRLILLISKIPLLRHIL